MELMPLAPAVKQEKTKKFWCYPVIKAILNTIKI